jgi:branched-chain amino acid transport system ATP-binding protein
MAAQTPALEIEGLVSWYGKVEVVSQVTLHAMPGETVALLGRNGAGKSAMMRTILGLAPPIRRAGSVKLDGREITGLATHEIARRGIGMAPDDRKIFPHLSVEENLVLAQKLTQGAASRAGSTRSTPCSRSSLNSATGAGQGSRAASRSSWPSRGQPSSGPRS